MLHCTSVWDVWSKGTVSYKWCVLLRVTVISTFVRMKNVQKSETLRKLFHISAGNALHKLLTRSHCESGQECIVSRTHVTGVDWHGCLLSMSASCHIVVFVYRDTSYWKMESWHMQKMQQKYVTFRASCSCCLETLMHHLQIDFHYVSDFYFLKPKVSWF